MSRRHANHFAALLWLTAVAPTPARAAEGSRTPIGETRLASGLAAHYEYHHDRNALVASRSAGDALIALTRSGNLLRFDADTWKLTREWFGPVAASCLGRGENDAVLVGFDDGRVCRLDPATLALHEVAKLPNKVQWVEFSKAADGRGGLVAVIERKRWFEADGTRMEAQPSIVHDLASEKTYALKSPVMRDEGRAAQGGRHATAFLLDRRRRLWLAAHQGEPSGWCARVDLGSGRVDEVVWPREHPVMAGGSIDGVHGFVELPDGQIWAHGGTMQMLVQSGFILRVDVPKVEELYRAGDGGKPPGPEQPGFPITRIVLGGDGKLLVSSLDDLYRVDMRLGAWSRVQHLHVRDRPSVPLLPSADSPMVAVHCLDRRGERLGIATVMDGYVAVARGQASAHALQGQLGLDDVRRILGSAEGTLFLGWGLELRWRLGADGWSVANFDAPHDPRGALPFAASTPADPLVAPDGTLYTHSDPLAETQTLARWRDGKAEILVRASPSLIDRGLFFTPDGLLWSIGLDRRLGRYADGRWTDVAELPLDCTDLRALNKRGEPFSRGAIYPPPDLRCLAGVGPPWILLERNEKQLLRFAYDPGFQGPQLKSIKVAERGKALLVLDAVKWADGELLLATDEGLRRLDIASAQVRSSGPAPGRRVTSLIRDGLGRVWLAGAGLWLVDADGKRLHDCGGLPMIGPTPVATLAPDPGHRDGVMASLGPRGVVFVRVAPGS